MLTDYKETLIYRMLRGVWNIKSLKVRFYRRGYFATNGKPLPLALEFQNAFKKKSIPEILVFGDSVSLRVADQDQDGRTLGQMMVEKMLPKKVHMTAFSAYTSYMHTAFLGLARKMKARPEWVVISYNLRCSSPQWDASPIWQYTQENAIIQALINNPKAQPGSVAPVYFDKKIYHEVAFSSPLSDWQTVGKFKKSTKKKLEDVELEQQRLKNIFILHYGSPMYEHHRQLTFLCSAIREALEMGSKVLVYITPINIEFIRKIGGQPLIDIVNGNCKLVKEIIEKQGAADRVIYKDWSGAVSSEYFFHRQETTEHLDEKGRTRLSDMIVDVISDRKKVSTM